MKSRSERKSSLGQIIAGSLRQTEIMLTLVYKSVKQTVFGSSEGGTNMMKVSSAGRLRTVVRYRTLYALRKNGREIDYRKGKKKKFGGKPACVGKGYVPQLHFLLWASIMCSQTRSIKHFRKAVKLICYLINPSVLQPEQWAGHLAFSRNGIWSNPDLRRSSKRDIHCHVLPRFVRLSSDS
ncbi:10302_t:CDS:2, partial [Acaulospora morrowiae]